MTDQLNKFSAQITQPPSRGGVQAVLYATGLREEDMAQAQVGIATLQEHQAINQESGSATIPAEVQGIKIGDCVLITSPAKLLVEVGLNLKKASPYHPTLVAAFSNGYFHYGPPAGDYDKGVCEVTECLLAHAWKRLSERTAKAILRKL